MVALFLLPPLLKSCF